MATLFGMFPFLKTLFADSGYQGPKFAKLAACLDSFPAVLKNVVEEFEVVTCKLIASLFRSAIRERCFAAQPFLYVLTAPLNHMWE